nr:putative ribonuclease H-like domain-containing protein [Tanacetum cinerariifolium]
MDSIILLGQKNTLAQYMILSGANNRPPMLEKDLYDSWKSRMELYMQNKENRRMILESVDNDLLIIDEGIDYEEVFAPIARIKAIWLFLAYAFFTGFMVYQMDVKNAFLCATIEDEVYVCQPLGFKDPDYPDKVYKVVKALYGKSASTPIDTEKPLLKDLDDIMFVVCAYARFHVTSKVSHLHAVKRIFRPRVDLNLLNDFDMATNGNDDDIPPAGGALKAEMVEINRNLMKVLQINQQVKAVTHSCENFGGPHSYNDCPATVGKTQNGNPQQALNDKGVIDRGCSRHMTGNISYLFEFEEINGGYVVFGGNPKGGKITGKGYLVRGLPSKVFDNNHTCVACKKGKQHRASCKTKLVSSVSQPLQRVLVTKPHNKTPYELLLGRTPSIGFMRPFGCLVTILKTLDPLRKFDGKADESKVHVSLSSSDKTKKHDEKEKKKLKVRVIPTFEIGGKSVFVDPSQYPDDLNMPAFPIPTTRVYKDHPVTQIIGDLSSAPQTRSMTRVDEGIDYEEVFAPIARIKAIWLFLAYAFFTGFMVYQMDVKNAFLCATIEDEVYVCQPLGFKDPDYPDKVYKVVKALYGLYQAPRA